MAHFCELDENNIVTNVYAVDNKDILQDGVESESKGIEHLRNVLGNPNAKLVQTSINSRDGKRIDNSEKAVFRHTTGQNGFLWDPVKEIFTAPQPYASWSLSETTNNWEPPVVKPTEEQCYYGEDPYVPWSNLHEEYPTGEAYEIAMNYVEVLSPVTNTMVKVSPGRLNAMWDEDIQKWKGLHTDGQLRHWDGSSWDIPL
jgi:hypothetical protein